MTAFLKGRIASWWAALHPMSFFVIICGIVAVLYFFYRIGLVAYPVVVLSENLLHPTHNEAVVCAQDDTKLQDPTPILSASYQHRLLEQKPLTKNLIENAKLTKFDASGLPLNYSHSTDAKTSNYQFLKDDGKPFLRAINKKDVPENTPAAAWLPDTINTNSEATYRYSLEYRSTVPTHITLETRAVPQGKPGYAYVTTLPATKQWQTFTMHVSDVASFRIIASGTEKGQVDTRAFSVQQIPDAQLAKGAVSVTFDDGWQSVDTVARPLLEKYDIRSTQFIISDVATRGVSGYMDMNEVVGLKKAGHEIGSHSLTHCNQTDLNINEITDNATRSKQSLELSGLGPIKSFAYPMGQYNDKTQAIFPKSYDYIRSSDTGYNDRYFDETNIRSMSISNTTSKEQFDSWIAWAKEKKQWLVLVYHRVDESGTYNITHDELDRQLGAVAGSGLNILPLSEAADAIRAEKSAPQKTPHELPHTGYIETTSQLLGLGSLTAATTYWHRSRRKRIGN